MEHTTDFPEEQVQLFAAARDGNFGACEEARSKGANVNFKFLTWREKKVNKPIRALPCISEVEYGEEAWFAGCIKSHKWIWRTYWVEQLGESWQVPPNVRPLVEVEPGDTLLLIALKTDNRPLCEWLLKQNDLDPSLRNDRGKDARAVATIYHREHLLSSRPEIMRPEVAALAGDTGGFS